MKYYEYECTVIEHDSGYVKANSKQEALEKIHYLSLSGCVENVDLNQVRKKDMPDIDEEDIL